MHLVGSLRALGSRREGRAVRERLRRARHGQVSRNAKAVTRAPEPGAQYLQQRAWKRERARLVHVPDLIRFPSSAHARVAPPVLAQALEATGYGLDLPDKEGRGGEIRIKFS